MLAHNGSRTSNAVIIFAPEVEISRERFKKVVFGALKKSNMKMATAAQREELIADVGKRLTVFFSKPSNKLKSSLTSLVYSVAMSAILDMGKREVAARNLQQKMICVEDVDESQFAASASTPAEMLSGEAQLIRSSEWARKEKLLRAAIRNLKESDRGVLIAKLSRKESLPRNTPLERKSANAISKAEERALKRLKANVRAEMDRTL